MNIPIQDNETLRTESQEIICEVKKTIALLIFRGTIWAIPDSSKKDLPLATLKVSGAKFPNKKKRKAEKFIHFHYGRTAKWRETEEKFVCSAVKKRKWFEFGNGRKALHSRHITAGEVGAHESSKTWAELIFVKKRKHLLIIFALNWKLYSSAIVFAELFACSCFI